MKFTAHIRPAALCALAAMTLLTAGCGGRDDEGSDGDGAGATSPGITETEIKLGASYPLSGPASAYGVIADGAKARFEAANAEGGVNGRKISLKVLDDGYEPQRAVTNTRKLVEVDKVFALFGSLGTANNLAVWDYTNQQKVPHVFLGTGGSEFGEDPKAHPYSIGWQPDYGSEARAYAEYVKGEKPNAKVAVLYQNDDFGKSILEAFEKGVEGSGVQIVAKESYEATDPTITSQMRKLASSGADTFLDATTPKPGAQAIAFIAKSNWKPLHVMGNVSASKNLVFKPVGVENAKGIVSMQYYKDPGSDRFANDAAMKTYKAAVSKYTKADPDDEFAALGWAAASTMVSALKKIENPTREELMNAVKSLDVSIPMLLPGVKVQTSESDYYPIQSLQIVKFDGEQWQPQGEAIDASGAN